MIHWMAIYGLTVLYKANYNQKVIFKDEIEGAILIRS